MAGRIRSIKPEWLDDEKLRACSCRARVLSVGLILLADDHGRGRAHPSWIGSNVFHDIDDMVLSDEAMHELEQIGFITRYTVRGQRYYEIKNWLKHQRVDKPGKPRVPSPDESSCEENVVPAKKKPVYFIRGAMTGLVKIGESIDPVSRLADLARCGSESLQLLAIIANGSRTERELHAELAGSRVHGEWFSPTDEVISAIESAGGKIDKPIATVGYDGRSLVTESFANGSVENKERFATDHDQYHERTTTTTDGRSGASRDISCPKDLRLTDDQRGALETAMIPGWAIDEITTSFVASNLAGGNPRPLEAWRKCLAKAVASNWNDSKRRPKKPEPEQTTGAKPPGKPPEKGQEWHKDGYWYYPLPSKAAAE